MSATNPANLIPRWSIVGMEGMFVKMWDPPTESPVTPELIAPTNPVPEVMAAFGMADVPATPHTMELDLLHGLTIDTWDGNRLNYFTFVDKNVPLASNGAYPGTTIRVPCGAIFHCDTSGKGPPPHTIHWHGMEPTPMNDGVGHCSMEIGTYTYQWQPTFVGTYFYHCHRNTMQHFEFGLFGLLLAEPADAYFATLANPAIPVGHCRDGKRRTGANLQSFPQFPGWVGGDRTDSDPWGGDPALRMVNLNPQVGNINPHAQTVPYDVEALWVFDDRDLNWSENANNARETFPVHGDRPGYNDNFHTNAGDPVLPGGFFAFNDFHATHWFVTGVPVPCPPGGTATIPPGIVVPAELNSGISGSQVSVEAYIGQTVLFRVLDAAYNNCIYKFPFDIVIIEWDGRPLGVPPYGFNEAYLVQANTPIEVAVGRRFGAVARFASPGNHLVECKFIDTRGAQTTHERVTCTAFVPVNIMPLTLTATTDKASPQPAGSPITVTATMTGAQGSQAPTSGAFEYRFWMNSGAGFSVIQDYSDSNTFVWTPAANGNYDILADIRAKGSTAVRDALAKIFFYQIATAAATGVTLTSDLASPQAAGSPITFTAAGQGGSGSYEYRFWINSGAGFNIVQDYSAVSTFVWTPVAAGNYDIMVDVRNTGSTAFREAFTKIFFYQVTGAAPATGVTLTPDLAAPQAPNTTVTFSAQGQGGSGSYEYRFWVNSGGGFNIVQNYSAVNTFAWTPTVTGAYDILVDVRNAGSTSFRDALTKIFFYQIQ